VPRLQGLTILAMNLDRKKHNLGIIRVLWVNLEGSIGGAERSFILFVRFVPKDIQIYAACPEGSLINTLSGLSIRTYRISPIWKNFKHFFIWFFYLVLINLQMMLIIFKTRPQIIHANSTKAALGVVLAKIITGKILIWHMRDLRCSRLAARICSCLSSRVIAVSETVKSKLIELGVKAESIEVIYNGVTTNDLTCKIRKGNHDSIIFANIGQFVPWKKQFLFVEAAERFLQDGLEAQFIIIGDDIFGRDSKYKRELINKVKASSFASYIEIIGWQNHLDKYWAQIDCLVHTAETEPFGRVVIEAMMHGVPVIAAESGGPGEIIINGNTGILFAPDDIEELIAAMKTISRDRSLVHNLVTNARGEIASKFQASETANRILQLYEKLMVA